jgi:hypothetical protein
MTEPQWQHQALPQSLQPSPPRPSPQPAPSMPPGWYPDPHGQPMNRWYDGRQWTEHVAPMAMQPQMNVYAGPQVMVTQANKRTSHGLHLFLTIITGGLWGIVWLCMVLWHRSHKGETTVTRVGY